MNAFDTRCCNDQNYLIFAIIVVYIEANNNLSYCSLALKSIDFPSLLLSNVLFYICDYLDFIVIFIILPSLLYSRLELFNCATE